MKQLINELILRYNISPTDKERLYTAITHRIQDERVRSLIRTVDIIKYIEE